ncbi:GtrA family protein [Rubinisphaera margarita]|uniref:GtrA family protein n=1 Tax=Rubinisphaera margarita TaxID=2909586 RepID=UPI001EE87DEE|nr:GtrA family protein [Rubinisphaera margarita]MCG6154652.1 GtrA family protein [Rubinisphaera margarita]
MKSSFDVNSATGSSETHNASVRLDTAGMPLGTRILRTGRWIVWRYRFLAGFVLFGFLSIALEVCLVEGLLPRSWPIVMRSLLGFIAGLLFAFYMNARFNFRVPREYFFRTFLLFVVVSVLSYAANLAAASFAPIGQLAGYPLSRFVTAGCLFLIAYNLHRRFTFRQTTRNIGLALYPHRKEELDYAYHRVGDQLDHVHIDIVDSTFCPDAAPVDLSLVGDIRRMWTWQPVCLHVMSRQPLRWIECCWNDFDWLLVHTDIEDDVLAIIARCREHGRKIGVVWHHTVTFADLMPFLPHVDFVMVLGIEQPGHSGQTIMPEAIRMAQTFWDLAPRYTYEVIFDGGITTDNVHRVPARYIVSSSSVLRAENPIVSALTLMAGGENGAR